MYFAQKEDTISVFPRLCLPALAPEGKTTSSSKLFTMQTSLTKLKKKIVPLFKTCKNIKDCGEFSPPKMQYPQCSLG